MFDGADDIFQTLRAWAFAHDRGGDFRNHRDLMKDTVIWNTGAGTCGCRPPTSRGP